MFYIERGSHIDVWRVLHAMIELSSPFAEIAAVLALAVTAGTAGAGNTQPTGTWRVARPADIPADIRVPQGHKAIATLPAVGVQTYVCKNNEWTFLQPDAILTANRVPQMLHSAGPVWTSVRDGSSVTGTVVKSSPVPQAVPQLLLRSTVTRGGKQLGKVTFIQRLRTQGGLAPTVSCTNGQTLSVPYSADYRFWVADK